MLLNNGQTEIESLLAASFTRIAVGTSDTPPTAADTAITGAIVKDVTSTDTSTPGYLTFNTTVEAADAAITIKEVGLLKIDGTLMYRSVVTPVSKVVGQTLAVQYKIKIQ